MDLGHDVALPVVLIGALLIVDLLLQAAVRRTAVPAVVVHLLLGFGLALADWRWAAIGATGRGAVELLGSVGIVFLLFRVGLESNVAKLTENLRSASLIWVANVALSGGLGYAFARHALDLARVPSLFVGVALTATSVGVAVAVWRDEDALESERGQLMLDVAELDDVSGIVLMAVLFAVAPVLDAGDAPLSARSVATTVADVLFRLALFAAGVAGFARFAEAPLMRLLGRLETASNRLISVVCVGLVVAAAASALGFSLAIGAFFAGLAFSRDPEALKLDAYFDPLYGFFTPFFFVAIGLHVDAATLADAVPLGLGLFTVAAAGKLLGGAAGLVVLPPRGAALLGLSLMPRAEIAMVVLQQGALLGAWAVSPELFSAMVLVSLLTCVVAPFGIRKMLRDEARREGRPPAI